MARTMEKIQEFHDAIEAGLNDGGKIGTLEMRAQKDRHILFARIRRLTAALPLIREFVMMWGDNQHRSFSRTTEIAEALRALAEMEVEK